MRVLSISYRDRLNTVLADLQLKGEYPSEFRVTVSEDECSLNTGDDDSDEKRGSHPPSGADGDHVNVFSPPALP